MTHTIYNNRLQGAARTYPTDDVGPNQGYGWYNIYNQRKEPTAIDNAGKHPAELKTNNHADGLDSYALLGQCIGISYLMGLPLVHY